MQIFLAPLGALLRYKNGQPSVVCTYHLKILQFEQLNGWRMKFRADTCNQFVPYASYLHALACAVQNARVNFVASVCQWNQIACGR